MFVFPLELCVKCYAFVFKSKLLRPSHIPYHITVVITNLKKKNLLRIKNLCCLVVIVNVKVKQKWFFSARCRGFFHDNSINLT